MTRARTSGWIVVMASMATIAVATAQAQDSRATAKSASESTEQGQAVSPGTAACAENEAVPSSDQGEGGDIGAPTPFLSKWKRHIHDFFHGSPEESRAAPLGASLYAHGETQVSNGDASRMVLYHCDFIEGSDRLNCRGKDQLAKIAAMLARNSFPIVVERTPCFPALAEARRLAVLNELGQVCSITPERVVIGPAIANGLSGIEAVVVYRRLLYQTQVGGIGIISPVGLSLPTGLGLGPSGVVGGVQSPSP